MAAGPVEVVYPSGKAATRSWQHVTPPRHLARGD